MSDILLEVKSEVTEIILLLEEQLLADLQRLIITDLSQQRNRAEALFALEIEDLLDELGELAEAGFNRYREDYLVESIKEAKLRKVDDLVQKIIDFMNLHGFTLYRLKPHYQMFYKDVFRQTYSTVSARLGMAFMVPDELARKIITLGGKRVGLLDLGTETKSKLFDLIQKGRAEGLGADALARSIREQIPAGPWTSARIRSKIIARTEAKYAQNMSALEGYRNRPGVTGVQAFDNLLGYNDEPCMARDKQVFSFDQAEIETEREHPNGTLTWAPYTKEFKKVSEGSSDSGFFGHAGRPGEVGGSAPAGPVTGMTAKALRAKKAYVCATRDLQRQAEANEPVVAQVLNGKQQGDNSPFDVVAGKNGIEVKTLSLAKNSKITMRKFSIQRKLDDAMKRGLIPHTVVFDTRTGTIYYKKGVGSFRISNMTKLSSINDLPRYIK